MSARWSEFLAIWPLLAEPALTSLVAGALLGGLSTFVVLARLTFVSAALGQVASLGVAAGLCLRPTALALLGPATARWSGAAGATLLTTLGAVVLALQARLRPQRLDTLLGLLFAIGAGGTFVVAGYATADLHDVHNLLVGDAVAVAPGTLGRMCGLAAVVLAALSVGRAALSEAFVDPVGAKVRGLPLLPLQGALLTALTVSIAYTTQILGTLPVFALSTAPACAAMAHSKSLPRAFVWATGLGAASGFVGYGVAYCCAWPVGATQALVASAIAATAWLAGCRRSRKQ